MDWMGDHRPYISLEHRSQSGANNDHDHQINLTKHSHRLLAILLLFKTALKMRMILTHNWLSFKKLSKLSLEETPRN